jgi:hypothetical protein
MDRMICQEKQRGWFKGYTHTYKYTHIYLY